MSGFILKLAELPSVSSGNRQSQLTHPIADDLCTALDFEKVNSSGSVVTLSSDPEDIGTGRTRSYFVPEFAKVYGSQHQWHINQSKQWCGN